MISQAHLDSQQSAARKSQLRSTVAGLPRMAVFYCLHRPSARWGFASAWRLVLPIRAIQRGRSEEHASELQSLMRISYAVFCLKKKKISTTTTTKPYILAQR